MDLCLELATADTSWPNMLAEGATVTFEAWGKDQKTNCSLFHPWATAPLVISSVMGALFCLLAFLWMFIIVVRTLIWGDPVAGWPTLACILLFIGGTLHISLGIIGQYLGKAYMESKHRPHYIVRETAESHCRDFACAAEHSGNNV